MSRARVAISSSSSTSTAERDARYIFLGRLHGLSEPEARKRSLAWCERLQLSEWTHKKVEELSKGMQQKVQFIAALLHDPDLVIMDEPFAGLDPANAVM